MGNYGDMQTRIADEMARSDLTDQIKLAILSAIEHYKTKRFWFNEGETSIPTTIGLAYYPLPTDFGEDDEVTVTVPGSDRYPLIEASYHWIREVSVLTTLLGRPYKYAIYEEDYWLYPIPDQVYSITFSYLKYLAALSLNADSNAWTTHGETLIRCKAKAILYTHVTRNDKMAAAMTVEEGVALANLTEKTVMKISSGRLKPTQF